MSLVEFIGFVVVVLALAYSFFQRVWMEYLRRKYPEKYEAIRKQEEDKIKQLLKTLDGDVDDDDEYDEEVVEKERQQRAESRKVPPARTPSVQKDDNPHRSLSDDFKFESRLDKFKQKSVIEQRTLHSKVSDRFGDDYGSNLVSSDLRSSVPGVTIRHETARGKLLLKSMGPPRLLIVAQEVIGPPKGMQ